MTRVCEKCGHIDYKWRTFRWEPDVELADMSDVEVPEGLEDKYFYYQLRKRVKLILRIPKVCCPGGRPRDITHHFDTERPKRRDLKQAKLTSCLQGSPRPRI